MKSKLVCWLLRERFPAGPLNHRSFVIVWFILEYRYNQVFGFLFMEVRVVFSDSEFESVQKCASEEGEDVSAFIRGATLELVKDIEDFKAFKEDMERVLKKCGL